MAERQINRHADIILTCSENHHYNGEMMLENHSLLRVLSGELKVVQQDNSYIFKPGDSVLFPRNQLATLIKYAKEGKPYKAVVVRLTTPLLRHYYTKNPCHSLESYSGGLIPFAKSPLLEGFFASILPYFQLENKLPEKLVAVKVEEAIEILRSMNRNIDILLSDLSDSGKIDLADFMEKNYMFNLPLEKFSYLTGRSLTTFKRDFRNAFQNTPQKWLTQKRLELAHHRLVEKKGKPTDIYFETGFENFSHFSFAFKKHFGYSPNDVKERH